MRPQQLLLVGYYQSCRTSRVRFSNDSFDFQTHFEEQSQGLLRNQPYFGSVLTAAALARGLLGELRR